MSRQHVHLTTARQGAKSGPRNNSTLFVYLSLSSLSRRDPPIPVYLSSNGVVLTPGDERGFVGSECFDKVVRVRKERIEAEEGVVVADPGEGGRADLNQEAGVDGVTLPRPTPTSTSKRGKPAVTMRFWDEVIWENGGVVDPPRRLTGFRIKL
jgi:hypothetical protein